MITTTERIAKSIYFDHPVLRDFEVAGRMGIPYSWEELTEEQRGEFREEATDIVTDLKGTGWVVSGETVIPAVGDYPEIHLPGGMKGTLVFIPDEEEK